ncbi:cell division protein FtsZ [Alphaproteobacteria bacterium]|nr:cell division protein FtsZ [Alphaproteobacteria bacterium]
MTLDIEPVLDQKNLKPSLTVMGVGGAGSNAVNNMIQSNLNNVEFIVANTDAQALENSLCYNRIQLGLDKTKGLGAGADPSIGKEAAEESIDIISEELRNTNMLFITAGLGGGTGTGALPVIASIAKKLGIVTVAIVSTPFNFEGTKRMNLALQGLEEVKNNVDTLLIIPNQNLFKVSNEQTSFAEAFKKADNVLFDGVKGLTDLITQPGLINLDFADVRTVIKEMGFAMMGTAVAEGDNKAVEASNLALTNPLIENIDMNTAKGVIVNISGGSDMTLLEVDHAANIIRQSVNPDANIIFGSLIDETLQGKLKISIFATGIEATGKKILYYPESENSSGFSSLQSKIDANTIEKQDTVHDSDIESLDDQPSQLDSLNEMDTDTSNSPISKEHESEDYNTHETSDQLAENNVNYANLEEKKKTGFFSMLSNLMSSSEKEKKNEADVSVAPEKKQKVKKQKTDPNLFLFNDVVDNDSSINVDNSLEEISTISDDSQDNALDDDIDTPSYLRKGSGH